MTEPRELPRDVEARLDLEWRSLLESMAETASPLALPPERRVALSRVALLAQLEEVREEWKVLRGFVNEELSSRFVNAAWTLKDLLAHLASWAREFRREVETVSRGESFDYAIPFAMSVLGPNQWNEVEVQRRRDRGLDAIFEEFEGETARLVEIVISMAEPELLRPAAFPLAPSGDPAERFQVPAGWIIAGKCLHDRYHIAQIRKRLRSFSE